MIREAKMMEGGGSMRDTQAANGSETNNPKELLVISICES